MNPVALKSLFRDRAPMLGWLVLLLLAAPLTRVTARAGEAKPATTEAADECVVALQKWYFELSQKMAVGGAQSKRKASAAFLPACEEMEGLFGKLVEKIRAVYEQPFVSLQKELAEFSASFPSSMVTLKAIHLDHAERQRGHGAGLRLIPAPTPA